MLVGLFFRDIEETFQQLDPIAGLTVDSGRRALVALGHALAPLEVAYGALLALAVPVIHTHVHNQMARSWCHVHSSAKRR